MNKPSRNMLMLGLLVMLAVAVVTALTVEQNEERTERSTTDSSLTTGSAGDYGPAAWEGSTEGSTDVQPSPVDIVNVEGTRGDPTWPSSWEMLINDGKDLDANTESVDIDKVYWSFDTTHVFFRVTTYFSFYPENDTIGIVLNDQDIHSTKFQLAISTYYWDSNGTVAAKGYYWNTSGADDHWSAEMAPSPTHIKTNGDMGTGLYGVQLAFDRNEMTDHYTTFDPLFGGTGGYVKVATSDYLQGSSTVNKFEDTGDPWNQDWYFQNNPTANRDDTTTITLITTQEYEIEVFVPDVTIYAAQTFSGWGNFTDTDPDGSPWKATMDYGDGEERLALYDNKTFYLSRRYGDDGVFQVTVTVTNDKDNSASDTGTVTVLNVAPTIESAEATVSCSDNGDGNTTVKVKVKNKCCKALSYVAISLPAGVVPSEPEDGDTYVGVEASYNVESPTNNPFYSIKFETIGEGPKNGKYDVFEFVIPTEDAEDMETLTIEAKAGCTKERVTFDVKDEEQVKSTCNFVFTLYEMESDGGGSDEVCGRVAVYTSADAFSIYAYDEYDNMDVAVNTVDWLAGAGGSNGNKVLFDHHTWEYYFEVKQNSGGSWTGDFRKLPERLETEGYTADLLEYKDYGDDPIEIEASHLEGYDVFIMPAPMCEFSEDELDVLEDFVKAGGAIFLMSQMEPAEGHPWEGDNKQMLDSVNQVADLFGFTVNYDVLRDPTDNTGGSKQPPLFKASHKCFSDHEILDGISKLGSYQMTSSITTDNEVIVHGDGCGDSWADADDDGVWDSGETKAPPAFAVYEVCTPVEDDGCSVELSLEVTDPGSDDINITVGWGDGSTNNFTIYLNNETIGWDPDPSPEINPRTITATYQHTYTGDEEEYTIVIIAEDDDSGRDRTSVIVNCSDCDDSWDWSAHIAYEDITTGEEVKEKDVFYKAKHKMCGRRIKFQNAKPLLGKNGAEETDRFVIKVRNGGNTVNVKTRAGRYKDWNGLSGAGDNVTDDLGFKITLVSISGGVYTIDVSSVDNDYPLRYVLFDFGRGAKVKSPRSCSRVKITRTYLTAGDGCDYDYNDWGMTMYEKHHTDATGDLTCMRLKFVGTTKLADYNHKIRLGIELDDTVGYSWEIGYYTDEDVLSSSDSGTGSGDLDALIFESTKDSLGHYTILTIEFDDPVDEDLLDALPFDPYMYVINTDTEIHIDYTQTISDNDAEGSDPFIGGDEVPLILVIEDEDWTPPEEAENIWDAYEDFDDWIHSGMTDHEDWYKT